MGQRSGGGEDLPVHTKNIKESQVHAVAETDRRQEFLFWGDFWIVRNMLETTTCQFANKFNLVAIYRTPNPQKGRHVVLLTIQEVRQVIGCIIHVSCKYGIGLTSIYPIVAQGFRLWFQGVEWCRGR